MPEIPSSCPIFSPEQLDQYLDYVEIPKDERLSPGAADSPEGLKFLNRLIRHQLTRVPFENLDLHYSPSKAISLDMEHVFHKVVGRKSGRGGYCMENNGFFATVLRSLGYTVMSTGGRVCRALDANQARGVGPEDSPYTGFGHQINIVTIQGKKYFCDVGFGNSGPTFPVPLEEGFTAMNTGNKDKTASQMRLVRGHIPENTHRNPEQMVWIYQVRFGDSDDKPWIPGYCFTEIEFSPADFEVMNWYVSTNRKPFFTNKVICQKFLMDDDDYIVGDITLFEGTIKERRLGNNKPLTELKCEEDRLNALEKYLGVTLSGPERRGILGLSSMMLDTRS